MKRVEWVDIFKGILILFVIFGHSAQGIQSNKEIVELFGYHEIELIKYMIYSFHMPAFFVATGLFYNHLEQKISKIYIKNKIIKIAYPYFVWSFFTALFMQIAGGNTNSGLGIKDFFYSPIKPFSQYWYLYVYLFIILTYLVFILIFKKSAKFSFLIFSIAMYVCNPIIPNFWILNDYSNFSVYFTLGLFTLDIVKSNIKLLKNNLILLATGFVFCLLSFFYSWQTINNFRESVYFLWILPSFFGTVFFIMVSQKMVGRKSEKIFTHFGYNSLKYYVMHLIPLAATRILLLNYLHINNLWIVLFVSFAVSIICCYIAIRITNSLKIGRYLFG